MPVYILILFFTIIIDYYAGIWIEKSEGVWRKRYLLASIVANIGILCVFKYYNFFLDNLAFVFQSLHINITPENLPYLSILLPIGLSFHTFQAMSYTIEVYRGNQKAERHFGIYSLYVMFYPQLVAGPIERPQNVLHQFHEEHTFQSSNLLAGLRLMLWGFFKKLVIADRIAVYVDAIYDHPDQFGWHNILLAIVLFGIQIYCDFSGYSDIALGSAKTMGFDLMKNFDRPFISTNVGEFWRRWHISLSSWFNDYLYSPVSIVLRNYGNYAIVFSVLVTFFISGLWHGAGWTFVIFGVLHGFAIAYEILTKKSRKKIMKKMNANWYGKFSMLFTLVFVFLSWVFFRADSMHDVCVVFHRLFSFDSTAFQSLVINTNMVEFGATSFMIAAVMIGFMFVVEGKVSYSLYEMNEKPVQDILFSSFLLICIISLGVFNHNSFIYFQF
ncbi:MAG TPA: MBOAT family O-acyltransferase [Cytophagaceae bacterium]|nr:MBOAT family O-acyltransferase [Cytophagaceae bacterium]